MATRPKQSGETEDKPKDIGKPKNPAAVALGKLGGAKGGAERARRLSPQRRKQIAKDAVKARWKKAKNKKLKTTLNVSAPAKKHRRIIQIDHEE